MRTLLRRAAVTSLAVVAAIAAPAASAAPDSGIGTLSIEEVGSSPVLSWQWGISAPVTSGSPGGGGGAGKAELKNLELTKRINPLSTELFQAAATGSHFQHVVVSIPVGGPLSPFAIEYRLNEVFVESVQHDGAGSESTESVSLAYGGLQMTIGSSRFGWANPG